MVLPRALPIPRLELQPRQPILTLYATSQLEGDLRKCQTLWDVVMCWRMTWVGKVVTQNTVWGLEKVGLVPKGTHDVGEALKTAGELRLLVVAGWALADAAWIT